MYNWRLRSLLPGDSGIKQTVYLMIHSINYAVFEGSVRRRAENVIANVMENDRTAEAAKLFDYVKAHFRYTRDPIGLEMIKSPEISDAEITSRGFFIGDCDDVSAYLAALLTSVGIPARLSIIAVKGKGGNYKHIYPEALLGGEWTAMECTAKQKPMGWEPPYDRKESFAV